MTLEWQPCIHRFCNVHFEKEAHCENLNIKRRLNASEITKQVLLTCFYVVLHMNVAYLEIVWYFRPYHEIILN